MAAGQEEQIGQTTQRGDNGSSQVVLLNATLQLNADDNSGEQIIRIRDKDTTSAAEVKGATSSSTTSSSSRTLLDNEHQVSGDRGTAKVNVHGTDTIVNISSQVAAVISGLPATTSTARPSTMRPRVESTFTSTTNRPTATGADHRHRLTHSHQQHQNHWPVEGEEDGEDEEDEEDEEDATQPPIKVESTTESNERKSVIATVQGEPAVDKKRGANREINGNYSDSNAGAKQPPSQSVPQLESAAHLHDNVMNIERAIGENGEQMIIIAGEDDEDEVVNVHKNHFVEEASLMASQHKSDPTDEPDLIVDEPIALPLRPIIRDPFDEMDDEAHHGEMSIVYAELHSEVQINCEVDMDIALNTWFHDGQVSGLEVVV